MRKLAIHVEEPTAGAFEWVLSEIDSTAALVELERADKPFGTYHQAMAHGLVALEALIDDLDSGPRGAEPVERAKRLHPAPDTSDRAVSQESVPAAPQAAHERSQSASRRKAGAFGFGLPS